MTAVAVVTTHACRFASAAARLLRAYATQFEAYRRLRHGGDQYVRVEHVHINEGAQAVIGNVRPDSGERAQTPAFTGLNRIKPCQAAS